MTHTIVLELEKGNIDDLLKLNQTETDFVISNIRANSRRGSIVNGFLSKLKEIKPFFCFEIIYDMPNYKEETKEILEANLDEIIKHYEKDLDFIFEFIFKNYSISENIISRLKTYPDLHIRYLFMSYIVNNEPNKIKSIYGDITKYLSNDMPVADVSELANATFAMRNMKLYGKLKEYIFKEYQSNNLAELLLCGLFDYQTFSLRPNKRGIKEFGKDADRYFKTASTWRLNIYENYSRKVSKELLDSFKKYLLYFQREGKFDPNLWALDIQGITKLLETYVDKYLDLSKDKTFEFIGEGSTTSCHRIGDYAFKLVKTKWSYEEEICPELYLVLPNLEEHYVRNNRGIVQAGIEVQKYLKRSAKDTPKDVFKAFNEELRRLGYYSTDSLINGECGDNTRLLDSYKEIGEDVPDWFKEYPLVLVDHDRIYRLETKIPRQQISVG